MQADGGRVAAVADHRHQLAHAQRLAGFDDGGKHRPADALARGLIPKKVLEVEVIGGKEVPLSGEPLSDEELKLVLEKAPKEAPKRRSRAKKPAAPPADGSAPPEPKPRRSRAKKAAPPAPAAQESMPASEAAAAEKPADDNPST